MTSRTVASPPWFKISISFEQNAQTGLLLHVSILISTRLSFVTKKLSCLFAERIISAPTIALVVHTEGKMFPAMLCVENKSPGSIPKDCDLATAQQCTNCIITSSSLSNTMFFLLDKARKRLQSLSLSVSSTQRPLSASSSFLKSSSYTQT
eukprot:jgi/Antlo1/444/1774